MKTYLQMCSCCDHRLNLPLKCTLGLVISSVLESQGTHWESITVISNCHQFCNLKIFLWIPIQLFIAWVCLSANPKMHKLYLRIYCFTKQRLINDLLCTDIDTSFKLYTFFF